MAMASRARSVLSVPAAGYEVRFVERGADNGGQRLIAEWSVPSYVGPPEHFHPAMTESWTVIDGSLVATVAGETRTLETGESMTVLPGVHHSFHAPGPVRWRQTNEPALQHEVLFHLDSEVVRRHGANGRPGPIATIRILAAADAVFVGPPFWLQSALRFIGRQLNRRLAKELSTRIAA
ncbi:cupin domain-containing protein [Naasia lichenicola]|nr:cupin domain-containing protein [Naasia lichenicola]